MNMRHTAEIAQSRELDLLDEATEVILDIDNKKAEYIYSYVKKSQDGIVDTDLQVTYGPLVRTFMDEVTAGDVPCFQVTFIEENSTQHFTEYSLAIDPYLSAANSSQTVALLEVRNKTTAEGAESDLGHIEYEITIDKNTLEITNYQFEFVSTNIAKTEHTQELISDRFSRNGAPLAIIESIEHVSDIQELLRDPDCRYQLAVSLLEPLMVVQNRLETALESR